MVLILSEPDNDTAAMVEMKLRARGTACLTLDTADFPGRISASIELDGRGSCSSVLAIAGKRVDLADVSGIFDWRPGRPRAAGGITGATAAMIAGEASAFLIDLWTIYPGVLFPGSPDRLRAASHKAAQLRL